MKNTFMHRKKNTKEKGNMTETEDDDDEEKA